MTERRSTGFTLIEVLAVVLLTSIVVGVALNNYVNLSRASERATASTRDMRRAMALLDFVARDLENAVLAKKPPETDPLAHPWLFYGEPLRTGGGADHLKFVTRGRSRAGDTGAASDLEQVVYALRQSETEDALELMRWSSPRLPEGNDRTLPDHEDEGAVLLADGLEDFGVTFIDETGAETESWDSSLIADSSELPIAVEIAVAIRGDEAAVDALDEPEPERYRRRVVLAMRPLDLEELLDPLSLVSGGPGTEGGADGDDEVDDSGESDVACLETRCAGMTACQAVGGCDAAKLSEDHPNSDMFGLMLRENYSFCKWRSSFPRNVRQYIVFPECR